MKKHFPFKFLLAFICACFIFYPGFSQSPLVKQWDARFGGNGTDWFSAFEQTRDGGYILGGHSFCGISGDKTQPSWGLADYWIMKVDANGAKEWERDFGGTASEFFTSLEQTSDGGYVLGGYTESGIGGDKTQASLGGTDYWIIKLDSLGNMQWEKAYGGTGDDLLNSVHQTTDGGYILGGHSMSTVSGDKTQAGWGFFDYWIIKIDAAGTKQWDYDFGGSDQDFLYSMQLTMDGGYMLGGYSASPANGNKTQPTWGGSDYWIVKIDSSGIKQWDKDFGGTGADALFSLDQTLDGGYILGGHSSSQVSGNKTQPTQGAEDYWIVKTDATGNKLWDKDFGGTNVEDDACSIFQTSEGGYLICGNSFSGMSGDKSENNLGVSQSWIVKMDSLGNKEWDKTIFTAPEMKLFPHALQSREGCYVIAQASSGDVAGHRTQANYDATLGSQDYWMIKFCDTTQFLFPVAAVAAASPLCPGTCTDFINLSTNATSFQWTFFGGIPATSTDENPTGICYNTPGNYTVTLIATGPGGSDTIVLSNFITVYPYPLPQGITQSGDSLFANAGAAAYQWYFNGNLISGATNYFYVAPVSGNYNVIATDVNGCEVEAVIFNVVASLAFYADEEQAVSMSPNPAGSILLITSSETIYQVKIFDVIGKELLTQPVSGHQKEINIEALSGGIYFLQIKTMHGMLVNKFIRKD